ncbi:MAG: hypothetical protein FWE14_10180 [Lachnospiraceae bacterium]|nr:hypothetical protein [Lachnospiraceae bacterium]
MKNWYYFIVGFIGVFSAITHTMDGIARELPILKNSNLENMTQAIFAFNYNIVAADHLGLGIALIVMAFQKNREIIKAAALVLIGLHFTRAIVSIIAVSSSLNDSGTAGTFWIPAIANIACIILLWLGSKVKDKQTAC